MLKKTNYKWNNDIYGIKDYIQVKTYGKKVSIHFIYMYTILNPFEMHHHIFNLNLFSAYVGRNLWLWL